MVLLLSQKGNISYIFIWRCGFLVITFVSVMKVCSVSGCGWPSWGKDKITRLPYCKIHQNKRTDLDRRTPQQKVLDNVRGKKVDVEKEETELQKWYAAIMEKEAPKCWETGEWIGKENKKSWHGSIAHVLPKSIFPSVKTNPMNYMILKMYGGTHGQYDSSWENASKMKVWKFACKIFNVLYPLLTREEKAKLPEIILQEIKPEVYNATS